MLKNIRSGTKKLRTKQTKQSWKQKKGVLWIVTHSNTPEHLPASRSKNKKKWKQSLTAGSVGFLVFFRIFEITLFTRSIHHICPFLMHLWDSLKPNKCHLNHFNRFSVKHVFVFNQFQLKCVEIANIYLFFISHCILFSVK